MYVHRSNRMERLVEGLGEVLKRPLPPFQCETIVIQSKGMERWLSMELSEALGVFANARFPFPRTFIEEVISAVVPDPPEATLPFGRAAMTWAIVALLPELSATPSFAPIRNYLVDDHQGLKRFQLAAKIAHVFDQYLVYRPEQIKAWEQGAEGDFQAVLWRELVARFGNAHIAARAERFIREWSPLFVDSGALPPRVSIIGISTLPPLFVSVLDKLAEKTEVHLFLLAPCREYFAELSSARELGKSHKKRLATPNLAQEETNPLLASLGRLAGEFQETLETRSHYLESDRELYVDPGETSLLAALQSDILNLRRRPSASAPQLKLAADDDSVAIHVCHSPMREVEVLRDQLLSMFASDPSLEPRHVVVMMPDVDRYAPFIDAVFGTDDETTFIPYNIADRKQRTNNEVFEAFLELLRLLRSRMRASEVLDLLQREPIRDKLGISRELLPELQAHVHAVGIRWSSDAAGRARVGQPAEAANTWTFGLQRMLLGYALPLEERATFCDTLPYDDVEGEHAEAIGQLAQFCEILFEAQKACTIWRRISDWRDLVDELLTRLFSSADPYVWQLREIRETMQALVEQAGRALFDEEIGLELLTAELSECFEQERSSHEFMLGGLTFCAMLPMRSVPFRVVCLMGMNDTEFPRSDVKISFDLIAQKPQKGDRSVREEDRYLFLEALLSARERLLITYVGKGVQDNEVRPPATVVSELSDVIAEGFVRAPRAANDATTNAGTEPGLRVEHPLQPFSPRYFTAENPALFSYGSEERAGAASLCGTRSLVPVFVSEPLALEQPREVSVSDLVSFFGNPQRFLLRKRLGVYLDEFTVLVEDHEPLEIDALERYFIGTLLLERVIDGFDAEDVYRLARAKGILPHGTPGRVWFEHVYEDAQELAASAQVWLQGERLEPLPIELEFDGIRVWGALRDLFPRAQVQWQYSRARAKHDLGLWIRHLALQLGSLDAETAQNYPQKSVLIGRSQNAAEPTAAQRIFKPVPAEKAKQVLGDLVQLFLIGQQQPLCLFPNSSKVYVEALEKHRGKPDVEKLALFAARECFEGAAGNAFAERDDPYIARVFALADPLEPGFDGIRSGLSAAGVELETSSLGADDFAALAKRVFEPIFEYSQMEEAE